MNVGCGGCGGWHGARVRFGFLLLVALAVAGCSAGQAKPGAVSPALTASAPKAAPGPGGEDDGAPETTAAAASQRLTARVRGLRGTLNRDDINQAMEARQGALAQCTMVAKRRLRYLDGEITIAFKVDAEGKPFDVRTAESSIGHQALQACLAEVLSQTAFPAPAGRTATRDFKWSMGLMPPRRPMEPIDPEVMKPLVKDNARDAFKACEARRWKHRYRVTLYVARNGRVMSQGAVVTRGGQGAQEHLVCLLDEVARWRLPRLKRRSKVSFELR